MSNPCDDKYALMLHRYELDLLTPSEREEFELHLLECDSCLAEVESFREVARHLNRSTSIREAVAGSLAEASSLDLPTVGKPPTRARWRSIVPVSLAAAAVLVLLVLQPWQIEIRPTSEVVAGEGRLLILPFENLTGDAGDQAMGEVISQLLITDMSQSRFLDVVSSSQTKDLLNLVDERRKVGLETVDPALLAAEKSYATWILRGTIIQREPSLVLTTELSEATGGRIIEAERVQQETGEDLFAVVDRVTVQVKSWLELPEGAQEETDAPVAMVTTDSYDAYRYYVEGLDAYARFEYDDAERALRRALSFDSTFAMAYCYLAGLGIRGMIEQAVRYSDRVTERERLFIGSLEASFSGDAELGASRLRELLERYPHDRVALLNLAAHERTIGHHDQAIALARRAIEVDPLYKSAFARLTQWLAADGRLDEALDVAEAYIAIAPAEPIAYYTKAEILSQRDDLAGATEYLERACGLDSSFLDYGGLIKLGSMYVFGGRNDEARRCFQSAAAGGKRKTRSTARTYLALIPAYHGRLNEALQILDDGIAADAMELSTSGRQGDRANKHFARSLIYLEQGNYAEAIAEHEQALKVHSEVAAQVGPLYRSTFAYVLAQAGQFERAEEIAAILKGEFEAGNRRMGNAYHFAAGSIDLARGNYDSAVYHLRESTRGVEYADHDFVFARALLANGLDSEAVVEYKTLQADHMDEWSLILAVWLGESYFYLGNAYEGLGQTEKAIAAYEEFLHLWADSDPGLPLPIDARQRLARLRATP